MTEMKRQYQQRLSGRSSSFHSSVGACVSGRRRSEFSLVFEDFMRSLGGAITEDASNPYYGKSLSVILEDIGRPERLTSSGRKGDPPGGRRRHE